MQFFFKEKGQINITVTLVAFVWWWLIWYDTALCLTVEVLEFQKPLISWLTTVCYERVRICSCSSSDGGEMRQTMEVGGVLKTPQHLWSLRCVSWWRLTLLWLHLFWKCNLFVTFTNETYTLRVLWKQCLVSFAQHAALPWLLTVYHSYSSLSLKLKLQFIVYSIFFLMACPSSYHCPSGCAV